MGNLFSSFDPSRGALGLSLNWVSFIVILFFPSYFWVRRNKNFFVVTQGFTTLVSEIRIVIKAPFSNSIPLFLCALILFIFLNNFLGLTPYVFTASRHLRFTFPLSLRFWRGYLFYSAFLNARAFLRHLVPLGTPVALVPFIVLIELISSVIRPITLAVRLAANIIAGHLLLVLTRVIIPKIRSLIFLLAFLGLLLLIFLEFAVAFIQRYVFIRLKSLYIREVRNNNL